MHYDIDMQRKDHPLTEDTAYVRQQFRSFNDQQSGIFPSKELHLFAYAPDQQIIGGLFGDISWGWLHVDILWVDEAYRLSGIGTSLMDRAETEARAMGVQQAYLETTDFQAFDFLKQKIIISRGESCAKKEIDYIKKYLGNE